MDAIVASCDEHVAVLQKLCAADELDIEKVTATAASLGSLARTAHIRAHMSSIRVIETVAPLLAKIGMSDEKAAAQLVRLLVNLVCDDNNNRNLLEATDIPEQLLEYIRNATTKNLKSFAVCVVGNGTNGHAGLCERFSKCIPAMIHLLREEEPLRVRCNTALALEHFTPEQLEKNIPTFGAATRKAAILAAADFEPETDDDDGWEGIQLLVALLQCPSQRRVVAKTGALHALSGHMIQGLVTGEARREIVNQLAICAAALLEPRDGVSTCEGDLDELMAAVPVDPVILGHESKALCDTGKCLAALLAPSLTSSVREVTEIALGLAPSYTSKQQDDDELLHEAMDTLVELFKMLTLLLGSATVCNVGC